MSNKATCQRAQDKQIILSAYGSLELSTLLRARHRQHAEISVATERLIARVDRKRARKQQRSDLSRTTAGKVDSIRGPTPQ